jgi:uncharacterized coiled-coil protein SlyX
MSDEFEERFHKLEAHLAHLEHQLEQLNEVVVDQSNVIARLKKEVQRQADTMVTQELERIHSNNQKPPHYQ